MSFKVVAGDLLLADDFAICHQVNCRNVMNSGLAKAIADRWPIVKERYHELCFEVQNRLELLGTVQLVPVYYNCSKYVVNIFGQIDYGRHGVYTDYRALEKAFKEVNHIFAGKSVGFPHKFGCGLGGGNWEIVRQMLVDYLPDCDVTVYVNV